MPNCAPCSKSVYFANSCRTCKRANLCSTCLNYALVQCSSAEELQAGKAVSIPGCRECFRRSVRLDLTVDFETHGPANGEAVTVVLVHGGGGSRAMYRSLAKQLVSRGYRCLLPDLPGHGGRMDDPVSVQSCVDHLAAIVRQHASPYNGIAPIYLGGSFGGYIGMEFLAQNPNVFSAAILACCSQTVGKGAGFAASTALSIMQFMATHVTSASWFVGMMLQVIQRNSKQLETSIVWEDCVSSGFYFHCSSEQTGTLRSTDSLAGLKKFSGPVLYLNGSEDHRDMLEDSVKISTAREVSKRGEGPSLTRSILYEGGNHFFSHDKRFRDRFEEDVSSFCDSVKSSLSSTLSN